PRAEPEHNVLVRIDVDRAPGRASRTDAIGGFEVPDALLVQEVLRAERPDRAQVHDVAGELVFQWLAGKDVDLRVVRAVGHHQLGRAGDLAGEPHAARTHDAAVGEQSDAGR